jgi:hypothetical protein
VSAQADQCSTASRVRPTTAQVSTDSSVGRSASARRHSRSSIAARWVVVVDSEKPSGVSSSAEVHGHSEPAQQGRPRRIEPVGPQSFRQGVAGLEVDRHERHRPLLGEPGLGDLRAFPLLGTRVVDLEHNDVGRALAVGKRIETRAEDDVLVDASSCRGRDMLLGEPAPHHDLGAGAGEHRVIAAQPVVVQKFVRVGAEQDLGRSSAAVLAQAITNGPRRHTSARMWPGVS